MFFVPSRVAASSPLSQSLRNIRFGVLCFSLLACLGCSTLQNQFHRPAPASARAETVLGRSEETRLGKQLMGRLAAHPGLSGFHLLTSGMDAFLARALMIDAAEHTIDLQYFIVENDTTTHLLFDRLMRAADRGVRVRMLIDDNHVDGLDLGRFNAHPNVQVRCFNPYRTRYFGSLTQPFTVLLRGPTLNRRMHNKLLSVDGTAAIIGGRNLADSYFEAARPVAFMDLDLWAIGPVVRDIDYSFEEYWQSKWAYPISYFHLFHADGSDVARLRDELARKAKVAEQTEYAANLKNSDLLHRLENDSLRLIWARAKVIYDRPAKVAGETDSRDMAPELSANTSLADFEVVYVSPYFIPEKSGMRAIAELRRRGVRVLVLTNALSATDIVSAYAGFARYRLELLKLGVELYELKPTAEFRASGPRSLFGSKSKSILHAKTYIFDRRDVLIGSFNMDPRSKRLNTEMGLIVHSPELALQVLALVEESINLKNSYKLVLADPAGDDVVWVTADQEGRQVRLRRAPATGPRYYIAHLLLWLFPLEGLL